MNRRRRIKSQVIEVTRYHYSHTTPSRARSISTSTHIHPAYTQTIFKPTGLPLCSTQLMKTLQLNSLSWVPDGNLT